MSHFVTVMALNVSPMALNVALMAPSPGAVPKLNVAKCLGMTQIWR